MHHGVAQPERRLTGRAPAFVFRSRRAAGRAVVAFCVVAAFGLGCDRIQQDRKQSKELRAASAAIELYSAESDATNAAHRAVLTAFAEANQSANLPSYKAALRTRVLPAMDAFIGRLANMPTGTPQLGTIHGRLVAAYRTARQDIDRFEADLDQAGKLRQFDAIRDTLQTRVRAYRAELRDYYRAHERLLREDPEMPGVPVAALPISATPVVAP